MVIIEQNINQVKYSNQQDKLNDDNCYKKLLKHNPDIIVLNEVTRPENIVERIKVLTNNKYNFLTNEKEIFFTDQNGKKKRQNRILILYDSEQFIEAYKNENLYDAENHLDFLHVTLYDKENTKLNVIGCRIYPTNNFEDAKVSLNSISKLINYALVYDNVVLAGDFNNGPIMKNGIYDSKIRFSVYNYHKIFDIVMSSNDLKILTAGIDTWGYVINNPDYENQWTYFNDNKRYRTMCDHFIVSSNFREENIEVISDKDIETSEWGIPNHRIVKLTGKFIKTHFGKNTMLTNEFRLNLCLFIEFFQYLERDLKSIYAKLIDGYYPDCFDEVAEKPIGTLIKKLKEVEKNEQVNYLSNEDYVNLEKVRGMRNYWCHTCYNETDSYIEQQPDMSLIKKHRGLLERLKKEREIVRLLSIKMSDISNKIPEKVGKWKLTDFIKIIGPIHYVQIGE